MSLEDGHVSPSSSGRRGLWLATRSPRRLDRADPLSRGEEQEQLTVRAKPALQQRPLDPVEVAATARAFSNGRSLSR
jgi:hypothetical protein